MDELEFYIDDNGHPNARGADERLATFIQSDLQESTSVIMSLIAQLRDPNDSDFNGNAHSVAIRDVTATIECTMDDDAPDRRLSRSELLKAILDWLAFIKTTS